MRFLILFSFIIFFISCGEEKINPVIDSTLTEVEIPSQESWNSKILFTEDGKLKAVLYSEHLRKFDDSKEIFLEGVKIDFYEEDGTKSSTLTSKKGKVDEGLKNMFAIDSVVAVSDSGVTLRTDELMWNNQKRKITTDKFVTIISPDEEIKGYGFESDQSLDNYVIYNITYITALKEEE
ncbi:MAG: LPS export ABC transporter periplasmic protein LptC [Ignavibacteria bacterium GWB2_35_6b]|nr:MAG: LPS export ABC transporter periplasmic protein LptC [Ignavibacteria bacterium GWB2_35_6b]